MNSYILEKGTNSINNIHHSLRRGNLEIYNSYKFHQVFDFFTRYKYLLLLICNGKYVPLKIQSLYYTIFIYLSHQYLFIFILFYFFIYIYIVIGSIATSHSFICICTRIWIACRCTKHRVSNLFILNLLRIYIYILRFHIINNIFILSV